MRALEKRQRISWVHHQIWGRSLHWEAGDSHSRNGRKIAASPFGGYLTLSQALTLKLWALVTLALSPGSTDATAAIFLLGEAGQRVAATLEEGMWRGITEWPASTCLPPEAPFFFQPQPVTLNCMRS